MREVTHKVMEYREFEQLVKDTYNLPHYSMVANEEYHNDSDYTFSITQDEVESALKWDGDRWEKTLAGKGMYDAHLLFCHLVHDGVLQAGEYLVEVCW